MDRLRTGKRGRRGFTLVEMIVVLVIFGLLLALAAPNWVRARQVNDRKACIGNLASIDAAERQWALENKMSDGATVRVADLIGPGKYLQATPACPSGGAYPATVTVGELPTCSYGDGHVLTNGN